MRNYIIGFCAGLALGTVVPATAATLTGSGYLHGWDVTMNGKTICYAPYIWSAVREIECD